jgi:hypothetical protein
MASWELPPFLIHVAERHHDSGIAAAADFHVAAVALADSLSTRLGFNIVLDAPRPEQAGLAAIFGLADDEAVAGLLEQCLARFKILSAILVASG